MLDLIKRGSVAGLTAGVAVAVGVLVYDLFNMAPLATPAALARNLMGAPVITSTDVGVLAWLSLVAQRSYSLAAYTLTHLSIFALVGIFAAWMFRTGRVPANALTGALFGLAVGTGVFYAGWGLLAPSFVEIPAWQLIAAMNAIAGVVLVAQLTDDPVPTDGPSAA